MTSERRSFEVVVMRIGGRDRFFTKFRADGYWVQTLCSKRKGLAVAKGRAFVNGQRQPRFYTWSRQ